MTNPFMPQQPAAPANPYAQPSAPAPANPYAQPQQQAPTNPYAQQQAAPPAQYTQQPQQMPGNGLVARPGEFLAPPPPSASGSGNLPSIGDLQGKLLIIMPESVKRGVPSRFTNNGVPQTQDQMTCTIVVLDDGQGGQLTFMPKQNGQPTGQAQTVQLPYVIKGKWITQRKLVEQLEQALSMRLAGQPGLVFGRLWKTGTSNNDPYVLAQPQPHEVEIYNRYVSQTNPFSL
jgi:hypothetical protein